MKLKSLSYHSFTRFGDWVGIRSILPRTIPHKLLSLQLENRGPQQATNAKPSKSHQQLLTYLTIQLTGFIDLSFASKDMIKALRFQRHSASRTPGEFAAEIELVSTRAQRHQYRLRLPS